MNKEVVKEKLDKLHSDIRISPDLQQVLFELELIWPIESEKSLKFEVHGRRNDLHCFVVLANEIMFAIH